jgi:hypothetical protein
VRWFSKRRLESLGWMLFAPVDWFIEHYWTIASVCAVLGLGAGGFLGYREFGIGGAILGGGFGAIFGAFAGPVALVVSPFLLVVVLLWRVRF